jgi:hypothetical protein
MLSKPLPFPVSQAAIPVVVGSRVPIQDVLPVPGRPYIRATILKVRGSMNDRVFFTRRDREPTF